MRDIRTFIDWLSYHPTCDEFSRALVMEYMASVGACCARVGRLHPNDSLEFLGEYGFDAGKTKQTFPSDVWRSWENDEALIALGKNSAPWNPAKNLLMIQLRERGAVHVTPRQVSILRAMVEGKTNHELANELGFSVSTIRHETMRIYQALSVSDRKEAAKKALSLALI